MGRPRTFDESIIIEKAANLFWKKGYSQTSIQDLVDHLGINRASLYNLYPDKDALFMKTLCHYQTVSHRMLKDIFSGEKDVVKGITHLFLTVVQTQKEQPSGCMMVNTAIELNDKKDILTFLKKNKNAFIKLMSSYLEQGVKEKQIPSDTNVKALSNYFFTFYSGLQVISKLNLSKSEIENTITLALKVIPK